MTLPAISQLQLRMVWF